MFDTKKFVINTENIITNPITNEVYSQLMNAERRRSQKYVSINLNYNFGKQQKNVGIDEASVAAEVEIGGGNGYGLLGLSPPYQI